MPITNPKTLPISNLAKSLKKLFAFFNAAPNFVNDFDTATMTAVATALDISVYQTKVTTGGVGRSLTIGNGAGAFVGQRKLVTIVGFTASDTVIMDHANMLTAAGGAAAGCVLDALNEFVLLEWTGLKWKAIYSAAGVVT